MKGANKKMTIGEYVYNLDVEDLEAVAFVSSRRLEKYLCEKCRRRYGYPRIHFIMHKSEKTPYLDKIFCSSKCFVKWVADNAEKLDEDMDFLRALVDDEE